MSTSNRTRRLDGWGFEDTTYPPSPALLAWLETNVGPAGPAVPPLPRPPVAEAPAPLPDLGCEMSDDSQDRLAHARGQGLPDILRLRSGRSPALPDAVLRPTDADQVERILQRCAVEHVRAIPWGGGTSVTGGVNVVPGDSPIVTLDLSRMTGLEELDPISGLATFGPGTAGPAVEAALAAHGMTLGHFPQSWELATVGGWVATRSSGQESLGYGRIEDMVAGLEIVAPAARWTIPALPASAAGPDTRHLILGSEGRLGVITRAVLRVRQKPESTVVEAALTPDLERGLETARTLVQTGVPLTMLRLSDAPETEVAMAVGLGASSTAGIVRRYLRLRGIGEHACLLLLGATGSRKEVTRALSRARAVVRSHRGVPLGRRPGRHWQADRFRHPYLREELLDRGWATDTLETAVPWAAATKTRDAVRRALAGSLEGEDARVAVLCHVSHPYTDGASLYFTFFFACSGSHEATIRRWARAKRAATAALVTAGATLSHHHGIGQWHAPWFEHEVRPHGRAMLAAAARICDPAGILNPHVLLDSEDRLEA
jgi:alkyldihydroxyacetonephosphate synthase